MTDKYRQGEVYEDFEDLIVDLINDKYVYCARRCLPGSDFLEKRMIDLKKSWAAKEFSQAVRILSKSDRIKVGDWVIVTKTSYLNHGRDSTAWALLYKGPHQVSEVNYHPNNCVFVSVKDTKLPRKQHHGWSLISWDGDEFHKVAPPLNPDKFADARDIDCEQRMARCGDNGEQCGICPDCLASVT